MDLNATDTILTFWLPVSAQVKTVIAYIESVGCSITLSDAVKNILNAEGCRNVLYF